MYQGNKFKYIYFKPFSYNNVVVNAHNSTNSNIGKVVVQNNPTSASSSKTTNAPNIVNVY